ncbi:Uncharacterised protein [Mycobacteroides abscessus subsp. abscessus]|nr:Uncharacterised protein [Mycobacteroides abscessus subsp. abscessus]
MKSSGPVNLRSPHGRSRSSHLQAISTRPCSDRMDGSSSGAALR